MRRERRRGIPLTNSIIMNEENPFPMRKRMNKNIFQNIVVAPLKREYDCGGMLKVNSFELIEKRKPQSPTKMTRTPSPFRPLLEKSNSNKSIVFPERTKTSYDYRRKKVEIFDETNIGDPYKSSTNVASMLEEIENESGISFTQFIGTSKLK